MPDSKAKILHLFLAAEGPGHQARAARLSQVVATTCRLTESTVQCQSSVGEETVQAADADWWRQRTSPQSSVNRCG
jgi:hypothetical protein